MTYVLGETWDEGLANYDVTYAREFRYDWGRRPACFHTPRRPRSSRPWTGKTALQHPDVGEIDISVAIEIRRFAIEQWSARTGQATPQDD